MALYNTHYYNETIRKYVIGFGHIFTNLFVSRGDAETGEIQREVVPVTYSPKEKFIRRIESDYDELQRPAIKLPRIGFEIVGYNYAPERKTSHRYRLSEQSKNDPDSIDFQYNPVPYDIDFDVSIIVKTQEEGLQIVEQIMPFFTPDYTMTMKLSKASSKLLDIPVSLMAVTSDDTYDGQFDERRAIIWTMSFKLKGYIFGPARTKGRILSAYTNAINVNNVPQIIPQEQQEGIAITGIYDYNVFEGIGDEFGDTVRGTETHGEGLSYTFPKNTDFSVTFDLFDENGAPVDFSGGTLSGNFKESFSSDDTYNMNVSYSGNSVTATVLSATTASLDVGVYIFDIYFDDGNSISNVGQGTFNITVD